MAYTSRTRITDLKKGLVEASGSFLSLDRVTAGSTFQLDASHAGKHILLSAAAGSTVTLPAGDPSLLNTTFTFVVDTLATSNNHIIKVANASDIMVGTINTLDTTTGAIVAFGTAAASDTITLNRSTTGSVRTGELITATYVATNRWSVDGYVVISGVAATPFSATV